NIEIEVITSKEEGLVVTVEQGGKISGFDESINIKVVNAAQTVFIEIINSDSEKRGTLTLQSTGSGVINVPWGIPKGTVPGMYTIKVTDAHNTAETTFTIK
ncbi:MAG: biofilm-associated protein, partial [Nitrosopumilales archaeon CG_4_10_14_0_8_um_filter_34_8]